MKTYISKTEISLSVRIGAKDHMHIRFNPTSSGGSEYTTNNPTIQKGLEKHPYFNKMFTLESETKKPVNVNKEPVKTASQAPTKKVVKVGSLMDAKDYLVDKFGISRTQLTTKAKISAAAEANNIQFDGLS